MRNLPFVTRAGNSACPMSTVMWSKACLVKILPSSLSF
jgi:hypothetical protein